MANFLELVTGRLKQATTIQSSAGAADAEKLIALDTAGKINNTVMPLQGSNIHTLALPAFEDIAAPRLVNIFNDVGTMKVRAADATLGYPAHGIITTAVVTGDNTDIKTSPIIDDVALTTGSYTVGNIFYLGDAGQFTTIAPSVAGNIVQKVGTWLRFDGAKPFLFQPYDYTEIL